MRRFIQTFSLCLLLLFWACRPYGIRISPFPGEMKTLQGYASLWLSGENGGRSRFSFTFGLPDCGRIDVMDVLGRVQFRIVIRESGAFFVLPGKKAFWQGTEKEIIERFLGVGFNFHEMVGLLSGKWSKTCPEISGDLVPVWRFTYGEKGRITAGTRGNLSFRIESFIEDTSFARIVRFNHDYGEGRIKILSLKVNDPLLDGIFDTDFTRTYAQKTWEEIQELFQDDN